MVLDPHVQTTQKPHAVTAVWFRDQATFVSGKMFFILHSPCISLLFYCNSFKTNSFDTKTAIRQGPATPHLLVYHTDTPGHIHGRSYKGG